jgi:hypothetical protein
MTNLPIRSKSLNNLSAVKMKAEIEDCNIFSAEIKDNQIFITAYTDGCGCCSEDVICSWYSFEEGIPILKEIIRVGEERISKLRNDLKILENGGGK